MALDERLLKPYDPKATEDRIYRQWEASGAFAPRPDAPNGVFSMVLPLPNVTGTLHLGHAAMITIEDILARYARMRGKKTLWLPGTDHAAIATQSKVEEIIYKQEGRTRHDLGREEFLRRVEQFAAASRNIIVKQIRKLGASVDWSREAFTLDEPRSRAVRTAFKRLYDAGLIYRGRRLVNWDPKLQTTVSDDEIEWQTETTPLYYLKYGPFVITTARPETKFGDKYVVVHPTDERYTQFQSGQKLTVEWINGPVTATVVKDEIIDREFGTGAMTITPAHDLADSEIAARHGLDSEQVIDLVGKLLPIAGEFSGQHWKKARPKIMAKLETKGLVEKIEANYEHQIAVNSRGGGIIEPQLLEQWFVAVNKPFDDQGTTLKELMRRPVATDEIKIIPERFTKIYFHWIDNLRDWCISRQIWYGHRIPVWRHEPKCVPIVGREKEIEKCQEIVVGEPLEKCPHCNAKFTPDPDTLDTWFSSGLWTFSTLGWPASPAGGPDQTEDLKTFHPTTVLETGYDILFFWVARMILMSGFLLGQIPFHIVYLHGLVRDAGGRKMSKSKGNTIDPVTMVDKYGADALRLALIIGTSPGNDSKISEDRIRGYKHFANKLWNIGRFILAAVGNETPARPAAIPAADQKLIEQLDDLTREVTVDLEAYRFSLAAEKLYHYVWHTLADKIIEAAKPRLLTDETEQVKWLLYTLFERSLRLLHPFAPFITEELWSLRPRATSSERLITTPWPAT
ncbi:MAG: valine--tRNA ligase [Candidatus Vogelbacteria bacterium]|nr:valine--tRNA ligase [Candidatus Vogelbacteria bacterium]